MLVVDAHTTAVGASRTKADVRNHVVDMNFMSSFNTLLDRVRAHLNVAIAEVGSQDFHQRADLGAAVVSTERTHAESMLTEVLKIVDRAPGAERFDTRFEYLGFESDGSLASS